MAEYTFIVPGRPSGKDRPRFIRSTGRVFSPDVNNFQAKVMEAAKATGMQPVEGPVAVSVFILKRIPESWSKKKKSAMFKQWCSAIPDVVNVEAAIHDGLKGIAYHDDRQVASWWGTRRWSDRDETTIVVRILGGGNAG